MKRVTVITGPTASGKTALAIKVAKALGTEIISADSRQFFKELNIGTAKPSAGELAEVKHYFINSISIADEYNAGKFETDALALLDKLFKIYDDVILCGGSGLYINALLYGFDELPSASPEIRNRLTTLMAEQGLQVLVDKLKSQDPDAAQAIDLNNPQRVIRALELLEQSGKPLSMLKTNSKKSRPFSYRIFCIDIERQLLYQRINERTDAMFREGLTEEVKSLLPFRHFNSLQTVGYKEVFDYLDGKNSLGETIELVKKNTRHYAKRQLTWFRKNPEIKLMDADAIYEYIYNNR